MNEKLLLEYLLNQGAQQPQQQELQRRQLMIDKLRNPMGNMPQGQMAESGPGQPPIYVRPHALQNLAGLAAPIAGHFAQQDQDQRMGQMAAQRANEIRRIGGFSGANNVNAMEDPRTLGEGY